MGRIRRAATIPACQQLVPGKQSLRNHRGGRLYLRFQIQQLMQHCLGLGNVRSHDLAGAFFHLLDSNDSTQLFYSVGTLLERSVFFLGELDLNDLFQSRSPNLQGTPTYRP